MGSNADQLLPAPFNEASGPAMELLRVAIVEGKPRFVITPNLWDDPGAWGILMVDVIRHLGNAYELDGKDKAASIDRILAVFRAEIGSPTSEATPL
jgi:hypothetical protein